MKRLSLILVLGISFCFVTPGSAFGEYVLKWHIPQNGIYPAFASYYRVSGVSNGNVEPEKATGDLNGDGLPETLIQISDDVYVVDLATGSQSSVVVTLPPGQTLQVADETRVLYMDVDQDHRAEAILWVLSWGLACVEWDAASSAGDSRAGLPGSSLRQNAPNPFNPTTTIDFQLQSPGKVNLRIYDVSGRLVRNLTDDVYQAGSHRLLWDGLDDSGHELASGTYFYQLRVNGETLGTQKAVILK